MSNDERDIRHELVILMCVWQGIMYIMLRVYAFYGYNKIWYGNFKNFTTCRDKGKFLLTHAGTHTCVRVGVYIYIYIYKRNGSKEESMLPLLCIFYAHYYVSHNIHRLPCVTE